ncbi:MAG: fatty acid desaturase [Deltaproteobacteria bacterium]|nr:fatty acid desaturase [Deltaproteobacteria bacterium]
MKEISKTSCQKDWFIISWMLIVHVLALLAPFWFTWSGFYLFLLMYFLTACIGITLGFHRLLSHRSFKAHPVIEGFVALCGTLALQGTVKDWVRHHRFHHMGSDTRRDPHNARRGFWFSHMGWILIKQDEFSGKGEGQKFTRDILSNRWLAFLSNDLVAAGIQILLGLIFLYIGGISWVLWGIFLRLFAVYHVTWFVNSATHKWGYRNFRSQDLAVNNWWVAILAFGEGWHNNHHRYSRVCPAGFRWWEIDVTWMLIRALEAIGLVTQVNRFPESARTECLPLRPFSITGCPDSTADSASARTEAAQASVSSQAVAS